MPFQVSPGINTTEIDLTTTVPATGTSTGAIAGPFQWGPVNTPIVVANETRLVETFGKPDSNNAMTFLSAANFLSYASDIVVVRAAAAGSNNAGGGGTKVQIENGEEYFTSFYSSNTTALGAFVARYPGELGNALQVSVFATTSAANSTAFSAWTHKGYFATAPGTSAYAAARGGSNDELHLVVVDVTGKFSGTANTVLETFGYLSKASDAKDDTGSSLYYRDALYNKSKYVYWTDHVDLGTTAATWGLPATGVTFANLPTTGVQNITLTGGSDLAVGSSDLNTAYSKLADPEKADISLVITAAHPLATVQHVIDNIANARKDCVAFVSPPLANANIAVASTAQSIVDYKNTVLNRSTSYAVMDSGWKYTYDKYNDLYRWLPLNSDIAGLCARTDNTRDPWYSPAGTSRGSLLNAVKLSFNPNKSDRDTLYKNSVNPVVSFPGEGIILFGDKTMLNRSSAFDRINVRRLFIVMEKAIAVAARSNLFEFNDEFTRAQFKSFVEPYLRSIKGRRGITDFLVVCDATNNTSDVIDRNEFVGDIYVKPNRSINFIQLNFVAVRGGVSFEEVVGRF